MPKTKTETKERAKARKGTGTAVGRRQHAKSRKRWDRILEAATALFNERGFAATSMQDISDRVELQKGSLYYYVDSKEMLLFEILRDLHHGGEALVAGVNFDAEDALSELRSFLVQIGIYAGVHGDRLRIFSRDLDFLPPEQQREIISERHLYRDAVERLINRAVKTGQVSPNIDVLVASQMALQSSAGISDWYRAGGPIPIERIAVQTAGLVVQGLRDYGKA